ncbi:general transcription factor IIH subunit 3 [Chelonus insularis]|uniref:general transcription factor IIH subunit 3 n=1 Tax=Chelonus insularis TaxID=460826 RepID=UPI00158D67FB|nr:general transcription factor IIH subunit 3 [Chelonus insularis]XP_034944487.1 general transcription factor IIH subunit 3 [Chelonus insularis]XP_034944488.1 general transcription factor IIH subunit 3 [Chelonus insularis]
MNGTSEIDKSVLTIILDVNPMQRIERNDPKILTQCIDSVIVFANAHLMQTPNNELIILACHSQGAKFLYPDTDKVTEIRQFDGQYEKFTLVEFSIRQKLKEIVNELASVKNLHEESLISGAMSLALCYIARLERDKIPGVKLHSRILIVTGSNDSATQYMNYMNIFFTSQKMGIIIDVCSLDQELTLLQQACDITGGNYLKIPQIAGLLQYLLWVFLPDPAVRTKLVLPPPVKVDYRAACFCHHELVDIGYVCSICLSIFCKFSPICTTCHTLFKMPAPIPVKMKKKKKYADIVH